MNAVFVPGVAITLWLGLVGVACAVLALIGVLAWWQQRQAPSPSAWPRHPRRLRLDEVARLFAEVDALIRQEAAAIVAATDAESAVASTQAHCRATQRASELAWHDYDSAQRAYLTALRARTAGERAWPLPDPGGAWPVLVAAGSLPELPAPGRAPLTRVVIAEAGGLPAAVAGPAVALAGTALAVPPHAAHPLPGVADEPVPGSAVSGAALAAYRRGDLSVEQLCEVFRRFSGWDRCQERHEREVLRRRAAEREARRRYNAAVAAERIAYLEADVAAAAARAWADEAADAAKEACGARAFADECLRVQAGRRRLRPRPVTRAPDRRRGPAQ